MSPTPRVSSVGGGSVAPMRLTPDGMKWHGAMTREQLLASGVPAGTISTWLRRGRLRRLLPRVYAPPPLEYLTMVAAALLWLPSAAASHRAAAWLWQMTGEPSVVELTVPQACSRQSPVPWLRLHRRSLPPDRIVLWGHLPCVEPEQTVLDCLAVLDDRAGALLIDTALAGQARQEMLRSRYVDNIGRRGSAAAARALPLAVPGAASHPERVLARALHAAGLTAFRVNVPVRGYVADLLDNKRRLIIEVDGWGAHGGREAFQRDRTRQNVLVAAGYTVLRYTANDVVHRLPEVLSQIRKVTDEATRQIREVAAGATHR
jgi:very-short-patch-repair endonuclease